MIDILIHIPDEYDDGTDTIDICLNNFLIDYFDGTCVLCERLPKGHGKIVDLGKIDEDRMDSNNPIIYSTINGEYIEAISLDYLNGLPTIIEADKAKSEEN